MVRIEAEPDRCSALIELWRSSGPKGAPLLRLPEPG